MKADKSRSFYITLDFCHKKIKVKIILILENLYMVKEKSLTESIQDNFARYAGSVILDRAICDARDMLKPAARMLIYSQLKTTKNTYDKPFVKSANSGDR